MDEQRGHLYLPLASPIPFAYGGDRGGANLFANSLVAVDIRSGEYVWHFQTIHHDLWGADPPAPPVLFDISRDGGTAPALGVTTKSGYLYILDRETGEPTLLRFVAVDDAGNLINPLIVEGQIHGGLAQGIGQAMIEEVRYSEDGQPLTGSFMDYAIPRAADLPRFELDSTVTPTPVNPLGAKGVGEAGTLGSTPCIVSAAVDALSQFGVTHIDMMLRPEKLWQIINGGQS